MNDVNLDNRTIFEPGRPPRRVVVTGAAGYLGSVLLPKLLGAGHRVVAVDTFYFGREPLQEIQTHPNLTIVEADVRDLPKSVLADMDSGICLAALSNDPAGDIDESWTMSVNVDAAVAFATAAKAAGATNFLLASSCSVYGENPDAAVIETSALHPLTAYAQSKVKAEQKIAALADTNFTAVALRMGTLFGQSPRMRYDLVVNAMTASAVVSDEVRMDGTGQQRRPLLHVADAADAYVALVDSADRLKANFVVYNVVGANSSVSDIAHAVLQAVPTAELTINGPGADQRDYAADASKLERDVGITPSYLPIDGIHEIHDAAVDDDLSPGDIRAANTVDMLLDHASTPAVEGGEPVRRDFLPLATPDIGTEEEDEVIATLRSGWVTTGPKTQLFEKMVSEFVGSKHAIAMNSCTAALHVALAAAGVSTGDEVITTPITWPSTANVMWHLGARPVFVDVEPNTLNIDARLIEDAITPRTRAIVPVHMAGQTCDMRLVHDIANRHGLTVIEDAAHAIGASYGGSTVGSHGNMAAFSFYPTKNMTTLEGGILVLDDDEIATVARMLTLHGISNDAWKRNTASGSPHWQLHMPGYKYNMTDVQASVGIHQLPKLPAYIEKRASLVRMYDSALQEIDWLTPLSTVRPKDKHAHHLYIVSMAENIEEAQRDRVLAELKKEGIGTGVHFRGLHLQPFYVEQYTKSQRNLPVATSVSRRIFSLPLFPKMTENDIDDVIAALQKVKI
ncbi:bifunctional SDR family oxidoreductase/aminotransferase class I/II-fold pyridoxal phosphate-dependent enzyme [Rhodococcus sp. H29-C3]|uniref:bifunctional SDR family oxidoreductase/aminotransferase class I/II-fold pyridoxal phosphate-dependent enzyme n=1 Tax=Rhodococcus sp. H29-C3 TaxID=3046307 RepID=UPI0024BA68DA|nr:bifunctional SDR family oxidoreductase/aminotransferase class I/II-fold pyridoxal phosphate-dependent enzyme [Rhodococcus sp. H29-C3]MDJ0363327.1 bifunctional SDR family oxidoreductase/aminotransferase class I/II-fold pyridoxal phosphate-dependent enzyme [Rhodococcus sp. H29-C3]